MGARQWTERDDGRLVDLIYDAAFDETLWEPILEALADRVGAHPANLLQINVVDGHGFGVAVRTPEDAISRYFAEWSRRNPIGLVDDPFDYRRDWAPLITHVEECIDRATLERSDYWNEFLAPIDSYHMIHLRLALRDDDMTSIGLARPNRAGGFGEDEITRLVPLHRHLIRAERMWRSLGVRQGELDQLDTLLTASPDALFFLDDRLRPLRWTAAAETLLDRGDMVRVAGGRLRAISGAADAQLRAAMTIALAGGAPAPVVLPATARQLETTASVARLGERAGAGVTRARCLLVALHQVAPPGAAEVFAARYGLTSAEAALAEALATGETLRAVADRRGVSINTVRNQLSAVFDKTDCHRQQDLVRLLLASG